MTVSPAIRETGGPPFAGSITPGKSASVRKPLRARKLSRIIRTVDVSRPGGQKSAFEDASKPGVRWSGYIPWNSAHGYCLPCRAAFTDVVRLNLKFAIVSNFSQDHGALLNCWVAKRGAEPSDTPPARSPFTSLLVCAWRTGGTLDADIGEAHRGQPLLHEVGQASWPVDPSAAQRWPLTQGYRLLTRAAPIRAATVRERFPGDRESVIEEGPLKWPAIMLSLKVDTRNITRYGAG